MYKIYQVGYGDTISSIANMLGVTIEELNEINGFNGKEIMMGDLIIVPNKNKGDIFIRYIINKGDTLNMIAKNYNVEPKLLAKLNGLDIDDYIYPNQEIIIPKENIDVYITKDGDTMENVLNRFNTTLDKLRMNNKNIYLVKDQLIVLKRDN